MKKAVTFSIVVAGFTAMASQIIIMREFLVVFYGNELSISFILANWLIGGAIGSSSLGRAADRIKHKINAFSICQIALSVMLPLSVLAIRSIKSSLNINTGEIVPFSVMIISSFILLVPVCAVLGFVFSLACRVYETGSRPGAVSIGRVYMLEAVGAIAGGGLAGFILIPLFNSLEIIVILSVLNIAASLFMVITCGRSRSKNVFISAAAALLIVMISMWLSGAFNTLDKSSINKQWEGFESVLSKNSIYGNIAVVKRGGETSFFENGLHLYTVPDDMASEEAVHFALLEHPRPDDVLLVGGGVGGLVKEILKEPVKRVDYVELDPLIIKMAEDNLPRLYYEPLKDPRVSIKNVDGRRFIKGQDGKRYDCVIINVGDPYTAQLNRYYTVEFFNEVKRVLKTGGVISFGLTSSEDYINRELGDFLNSVYATLKEVFPEIKIMPGQTAYFLASDKKDTLTYDYKILMERARERGLDLRYVREYYLFSKLSDQRIKYTEDAIKGAGTVKINRDSRPISYYYGIISWAGRFKGSIFGKALKAVREEGLWYAILAIYALIFLSGLIGARFRGFYKKAVLTAVITTGFSEIAFQVVVLLSFQSIYGYVFYKLGIILTSFMAGLALGGWSIVKMIPRLKDHKRTFALTQGAICIYPAILPVFFWWLAGSKSDPAYWFGSNLVFPLLPVVAGFIGGFQFPLASGICLDKDDEVGRVAGSIYGMDLFGSCLGAALTGVLLIPVLGIPKTCLAVSGMNLAVLILLLLSGRKEGRRRFLEDSSVL